MGNYYSPVTGMSYNSLEQKESFERKYLADQQAKQNKELERANFLQQQRLDAEREYRFQQEEKARIEEEAKIEAEKIKACQTIGLDYDLLNEFYRIEVDCYFDWNRYLRINKSEGEMILINTGADKASNKIITEFKTNKTFYYMFNTFSFISAFFMMISIMSEMEEMIISTLVFLIMFLPFSVIYHKKYKKALDGLNKIKKFFQDYVEAGNKAVEKFKEFRKENYISVYEKVIENVTFISIDNNSTKQTRVEKLKNNSINEDLGKINNGAGEKYNYKMASILDEYDEDVKKIVDKFCNKNNVSKQDDENNDAYCSQCGSEITNGENFCGKCGNKI